MKGKTTTGFDFDIPDENFDMEFLDALADLTDDPVKMKEVLDRMFDGTDLKKRLYDHVRTENGKVPPKAIAAEIAEIFKAMPKNS